MHTPSMVGVCVRVCVCACVHACVRACVCVGSAEMLEETQGQCSATVARVEEAWTTTLGRE